MALVVKNPPPGAGDLRDGGSVPESGSSPGRGHNSHSSILAWRIPQIEEPGGLQPIGLQRVGPDLAHSITSTEHKKDLFYSSQLLRPVYQLIHILEK